MADLFQALLPHLEREEENAPAAEDDEELADAVLKLAIVGRPNAGKSTLINRRLGEDRLTTGTDAGIRRDSIATVWEGTAREGQARESGRGSGRAQGWRGVES